jgi:ribosomal protein S18 acetylase RimI-like enzyme
MPAIELDDITPNNKSVLEVINTSTLPTTYPQEFYNNALNGFCKFAYYGEVPVGAIKAKLMVPQHHKVPTSVYIESLAVLEPYRHLGIGKKLVNYAIEEAKKSYIHEITLHVWVKQQEVKEWYEKLGFTEKEIIPDYYKQQQLEQPDAVLMSMKF